ncbi:MAG: family 20 glycosylhydrolase [Clostridia bacterium]|nr:family 20 glycosylhydrolase [Clostridia bacterium]
MIFPIPKTFIKNEGTYTFKNKLCTDDLYTFWKEILECNEVSFDSCAQLKEEAYTIDVDSDGVRISSSTEEGAYRAVTSLFQLFKRCNGEVPYLNISDDPDYKRRCYMLEISGGRTPKLETLKEIVDLLSLLKYNEMQLYVDAFCYDYPLIPDVTEGKECLTPDDIVELDKYCKERFIDLVPNQNCFGHMEAWLERDEYKHLEVGYGFGEKSGTINPLLDETTELVNKIFDSVLPYYSSEYVNIGLDEAGGLGKYELEEYCNEHGNDTLFMENLNRIANYIEKNYGKKVQFWSDMINNSPDSFKMIPKGAIAMEWGYEIESIRKIERHCKYYKEKGIDFYVCPSCNTHYAITGRHENTSIVFCAAAEIGKQNNALGYLITDWCCPGEGHPHFPVWSYMTIALGAMYSWNISEKMKELKMETCFDRRAREFLDFFMFESAPLSQYLQALSNYFLLEPDRTRLGTLCGMSFWQDMSEMTYGGFFDLNDNVPSWHFDQVVWYVKDVCARIDKLNIDSRIRREIMVNANMVIMAAIVCKVKIDKTLDKETAAYFSRLADETCKEYRELWHMRNYPDGVDIAIGYINKRKEDILSFVK